MKLKELRNLNNLTQQELSKKINITQFTYCNYETGKTEAPIETLCKIADYYGVTLDYLCDHKTNNVIDVSSLSKPLVDIINVAKNFSEKQLYILQGATLRIAQEI